MTVPAIEPMSPEEREYRGKLLYDLNSRMQNAYRPVRVRPDLCNPKRSWTALECRLMAASNALRRVI